MNASLRNRAEAILKKSPAETSTIPMIDVQELLHELQVYQAELEIQNEELRRSRQELAAARDRFKVLYHSVPVACLTLDAHRTILDANDAAVSMLDARGQGLAGKRLDIFMAPEDADACYLHLHKAAETGVRRRLDVRLRRTDGALFWVAMETVPERPHGTKVTFRIALFDITERKRAEESARQIAALLASNAALDDSRRAALAAMEDAVKARQQAECAEEALRASEELYWQTLQALPAHIAVIDRGGRVAAVNEAWQQFARDNDAAEAAAVQVGANYLEACRRAAAMNDADAAQALAGIEGVLSGSRDQFVLEYPCHSPQQQRWFLMTVTPLSKHGTHGAVISHFNISERKQSEAVLRFLGQCPTHSLGEAFFRDLARFLAQTLDMDFVCIDRLESDQLFAQTLAVFHNGQFEDNVSYALKDTPCGGVVGKKICSFPQSVRSFFPSDEVLQSLEAESYFGSTLWDSRGKPIGLIAVIGRKPRPETRQAESILQMVAVRAAGELERLQAERAIAQLNADLERRVEARTAELAATNRELEAFCYTVSHDLRAPLRSMDGFSLALLEDYGAQLDATGQDYLNRVRSNCQRMARLIDDLLQLSRLTRSQMRYQPVDLTALAETSVVDLRQAHPDRTVDVRIAPGLKTFGDPALLGTAMVNLVGNAWKFTERRPDGVIEVGQTDAVPPALAAPPGASPTAQSDTHPAKAFFVRDNGVGFDMQYADKLFTPFQRLHAMTEFPGSGIGLATVQRVLNRHGGRIWFESAAGQGATFYFTIGAEP